MKPKDQKSAQFNGKSQVQKMSANAVKGNQFAIMNPNGSPNEPYCSGLDDDGDPVPQKGDGVWIVVTKPTTT